MKVLHIGKKGNMERFSAPDSLLSTVDTVDLPMGLPVPEYLAAAGDADFIITDAIGKIPGELIRQMPNLKSIHSEGVAFNAIDLAAADACHVCVCHSKGMNAMAVAEQTILLMTGMLRDVVGGDAAVRKGRQIQVKEAYMQAGNLHELADFSIGLVGYGDIARCVARLLRVYGVQHIAYCKRHPLTAAQEAAEGVHFLPLDDLLAQSQIVSLHLPVTPETTHMADRAFFHRMQTQSYFVNTSRGELVDDAALLEALADGTLCMAGLDTLDQEPVASSHPLLQAPPALQKRLLLSPHIGGITASSFRRSYQMIWEDIAAVAAGRVPARTVNHPRG